VENIPYPGAGHTVETDILADFSLTSLLLVILDQNLIISLLTLDPLCWRRNETTSLSLEINCCNIITII